MKNSLIIILAFLVGISVFFLGKQKQHHKMHFHGQQIGHENLKVVQPYARVSSASAKSGAIFFIIENGTNLEHKLIGATTDVAKKAELHTHSVDGDGVMSMSKINDGINIEPKSRSIFKRGGNHVMIMGLNRSLMNGDKIHLELMFENKVLKLEVLVDNKRSEKKHDHKMTH